MIKKILLSVVSIAAVGGLAFGATQAFFSDTETSEGNFLQAGSIDLKVDNTCYYNGNACVEGVFEGTNVRCDCTWESEDLTNEHFFFNLSDLKPGDWEEDTISLKVINNDSWLCEDITLTSNEDNGITEPEGEDGDADDSPGNGELADAINFLWWADDGDNVLETCEGLDQEELEGCVEESPFLSGPFGNVNETTTVALADSGNSLWGEGPFPGGNTRFIGKGWCFGDIEPRPLLQDGESDEWSPSEDNNEDETVNSLDGGFACDGEGEDNTTQTDSLTADIGFRAVQSRNNDGFLCNPQIE